VVADPAVMGAIWGITSVTCIPVSEIFEKARLVMISPGAPIRRSLTGA
jgi:branched-chain amino acid transport system substrate-binding protein